MSWNLGGSPIPAPHGKSLTYDVQEVTHRTLNGRFTRDFVGTSKRVISADYHPISAADFGLLYGHYADQRDNGTSKTLVVGEFEFSAPVLISIESLEYPYANHYDYRNVKFRFTEI